MNLNSSKIYKKICSLIGILSLVISSLSSQIDLSASYSLTELQSMLIEARERKSQKDLADTYFLLAEHQENKLFNSELALELYIRSMQYYENTNNQVQSNKIKTYIADRHFRSGFLKEALETYQEVLAYYRGTGYERGKAYVLYEMSKIYEEKADVELSLQALEEVIKINNFLQDSSLLIDIYLDKVKNYMAVNERDSALITSTIAFDIATKIKNNRKVAKSLYFIGTVNLKDRDYKKAIKYLSKSLEILTAQPFDEDRRMIYQAMIVAHESTNDYEKSYDFSKKYIQLNDSILNHDRITSINNLSIKHQSFEKNKEIQLLEMEKQTVLQRSTMQRNALYFVAGGFGLLLIALYYIIRFYSQRMKTEKIINDQQHKIDHQKIKELEDTMQINNMQSMIVGQERERERIAKDLHDSLGGLLSTVKLQFDQFRNRISTNEATHQYDKAAGLLDNAVEEVRVISRNLQPGALSNLGLVPAINDLINRFDSDEYPDVFFQHYNLPDKLDDMVALNIYRIVQELLTNTIKYAHASEVLIQINYEDNELYVQYEDDGKGFDIEKLEKRGMGLNNINSRIKYLKGQISIESKPNEGVSFLIKMPYVSR